MAGEPRPKPTPDDQPSDAVLDELLRAFTADDPSAGEGIDLNSPEVEALLSGELSRPTSRPPAKPPESEPEPISEVEDEPEPRPEPEPQPSQVAAVDDGESERPEPPPIDPLLSPAGEDHSSDEAADEQAARSGVAAPGSQVVRISGDDDLPDAMYIEGDLEQGVGGPSTTVFIDDGADDVGQIVGSAEAARASGIEPKLRERRIAIRRAESRKRLRWVVLGVVLLLIVIAGLAVLGSSLFSIEEVKVSGAVNSKGDALDLIVADLEGEAVLRVDSDEYERRIEAIPWVEHARVTTKFPSSARIEIKEREPVAAYQGADGRYRVIDHEGRVLNVLAGQPVEYLAVSTDNPPNAAPGQFPGNGFTAAGLLAQVLTPTVRPLVDSIVVAADGSDVRLQLEGGTEVMLGEAQFLVDKLVRLETVVRANPDNLPARIDVSTDEVTFTPG